MKKQYIEKAVTSVLVSLSLASVATAHDDLGETTVLATGFEKFSKDLAYATTVIFPEDYQLGKIPSLEETLQYVPGVITSSSGGQRGSVSSIFIRGMRTADAQLRIDGVRVSNANFGSTSNNLVGILNSSDLSMVEILRGAQSARYGSDAMAGVIGISQEKGQDLGSTAFFEAGSFGTLRADYGHQGVLGKLSYSYSFGYEQTSNDLEHNDFYQNSSRLRLDYALNDEWNLGLTFRHGDSNYEAPDYGGPFSLRELRDHFDYTLTTLYAEGEISSSWKTRVTLGHYQSDYDNDLLNPRMGFSDFWADSEQLSIEWDNEYTFNDENTLTFGAAFEDVEYDDTFVSATSKTRRTKSLYVNHDYKVSNDLSVTGGLRWEDYSDFDEQLTYRTGLSYKLTRTASVRASYGKAHRVPGFERLYGTFGNPNLRPQTSHGWDVGFDKEFSNGDLAISYFESDIENAMSLFGSTNIPGKTKVNGIELGYNGFALNNKLQYSLNYTWLEHSLDDLPEHSAAGKVSYTFEGKTTVGASVQYLDNRSFGSEDLESYVLVGAFVKYQWNQDIALHLRVENLTDENYEQFNNTFEGSFPGRGAGYFAGVTVNW